MFISNILNDIRQSATNEFNNFLDNFKLKEDELKNNIKIDASICQDNGFLEIKDENNKLLFSTKAFGENNFSKTANKTDKPTPQGERTIGLVIQNHTLTLSNICIGEFEYQSDNLEQIVNLSNNALNATNNLLGLVSQKGVEEVSKTKAFINDIYSKYEGYKNILNNITSIKDLFGSGETIIQKKQTALENILIDLKKNGKYKISYCGKSYNNMTLIDLSTSKSTREINNLYVNMTFSYNSKISQEPYQQTKIKLPLLSGITSKEDSSVGNAEVNEKTLFKGVMDFFRN